MPHPEREHELQIALATALRERDEARERWTYFLNQATAADAAIAAARRECDEQREAKEAAYDRIYKALAALDADDLWSTRVINARAALAAPGDGEEGKR